MGAKPLPCRTAPPALTMTRQLHRRERELVISRTNDAGKLMPGENYFCILVQAVVKALGGLYLPAPFRLLPDNHLHVHLIVSAAAFYGTLRQILSWRLGRGHGEVLRSFLEPQVPSLIAELLDNETMHVILA